ncbi:hypothetical protein A4X13_0g2248 [Tilletia indica]|uniref:Uncharacterized protein n=1 Tax=Tilletia indica TaxID=43049 RepID=A0A177TGR0_9BASI|nr:hypothetical protein A4X13_0g2248 [Tilletia indica]
MAEDSHHAPQQQQQQQSADHPQQQQQHQPRAGMLTRAFNSLQLGRKSGAGGKSGHSQSASSAQPHSITSSKFFDPAGNDADAVARKTSALSTTQQQRDLHAFTGVFPVPAPGCSPSEPPPQHTKLTKDQNTKYEAILAHFSQPSITFPVSFAPNAEKRECNEWETSRLLTRESLLRYLRAAKWDLNFAKKRLIDTIIWRREYGVDDLKPDEIEPEAESGKETVLGFDKRGRPLHYMTPHLNNTKESPRQMKFAVWILERAIDLMPPGVEQLALLINFQHKSRNPTSIANAKLMLYILQNHYVERLGIALCINVPWIFKTFFAAVQPFIDPVTREKCKFDEAIKDEVPLDQLNSDYGGNVDPKYDHSKYWPDLVRTCDRLREKQMENFRELCGSKVGASEWLIRGGDPAKAPGLAVVQTDTKETAVEKSQTPEKIAEVKTHDTAVAPVVETTSATDSKAGALTVDSTSTGDSASSPSTDTTATATTLTGQAAGTAATVATYAAESAKGLVHTTGEAAGTATQAALPVLNGIAGYAQMAAQTAVQIGGKGASVAEGMVAKLTSGVVAEPGVDAAKSADGTAAADAPHALHAEDLARAPPADVEVTPLVTPSADKLASENGAVTSAVSSAAPAPALQGEQVAGVDRTGGSSSSSNRAVTVLYFAAARSAAGTSSVQIRLPPPPPTSTSADFSLDKLCAVLVEDARSRLDSRTKDGAREEEEEEEIDPDELERVLGGVQLSVDEALVDEEEWGTTVLKGGEEVGVIPPVSGG